MRFKNVNIVCLKLHFRARESMYHALGYSTIMFLQAVMTFEQVGFMNVF